ncbi:hypothetical protein BS47DRAFT_1122982 [Hydnum rufescens UP504]|uniref:SH3 domain-containing protein n=1 Tax=Hydnum rufescens UP504 TaxID=1448309 RepID=A0A9P6AU05_9AGAM|nr:hypothetical protein BS47DRAFT_1122982 [Hydnum rufescens UP504]
MRPKRAMNLTLSPTSLFPSIRNQAASSANLASPDPFTDPPPSGFSQGPSDTSTTRYLVSPLSGHFVDLVSFPSPPTTKTLTRQTSIQTLSIPENSSFDLPYDGFFDDPSSTHLGMPASPEDPFADSPNVVLAFSESIRAVSSRTEPDVGESRRASISSNMTRVARSWDSSSPEDLSVSAGDVVRVISRHAGNQRQGTAVAADGRL